MSTVSLFVEENLNRIYKVQTLNWNIVVALTHIIMGSLQSLKAGGNSLQSNFSDSIC